MSNVYGAAFSNTIPSTYPSLAPTFITFKKMADGSDLGKPAITQLSTTGIYQFTYSASFSVYFLLDAITVNSTADRYVYGILDPIQRVDQQLAEHTVTFSAFNSSLIALGTTSVALGTTGVALGTTAVALGTTAVALGTSAVALGTTAVAIGTTILAGLGSGLSLSSDILLRIGTTGSVFGTNLAEPVDLYGYMKRIQEFLEGDKSFTKTTGVWAVSSRGGSLLASKIMTNTSTVVTSD